ncbi:MAG TPA: hypothetical protein ENN45_01105 [Bacteroidetes bacterium]|nr:hypothetical protein [Bacteroidota bacterium]
MKAIFSSKYQKIFFAEDSNILKFEWLDATKKISDLNFLKEINIAADFVLEFVPQKIMVDTRKLFYPISPDIQRQVDNAILPSYQKVKLRKLAFVLQEEDLISQISVKQTVETTVEKHLFETRYFFDELDAMQWLEVR